MKKNSSEIIELYIEGKDFDKYSILEDIYSSKAEVEFEIASSSISFPDNIIGNEDIARVLSKNFNKQYAEVKTYCLSKPASADENVYQQRWLVVMRDSLSSETRIGTGYYDWEFSFSDTETKIQKHRIYIHEMLSIEDHQMVELKRIQNLLPYPWLEIHEARDVLGINNNLKAITEYLK